MEKREFEVQGEEREKFTSKDVEKSLQSLSKEDWERANWPLVVFVPRDVVRKTDGGSKNYVLFWEEVFNPENFIYPGSKKKYDSRKHSLYILHSLEKDATFKTITTNLKGTSEDWLKNPRRMINYKLHGEHCENQSNTTYPTCFWEKFSEKQKKKWSKPDLDRRRDLILQKYFGESP